MSIPATVLYVTADYHGASSAISVRSRFSVKLLRSQGFEVEVLTTCPVAPSPTEDPSMHMVGSLNVTGDARLLPRLLSELVQGVRFALTIWRLHKRCGLVVLTSPPFFTNVLCALGCVLARMPYVLDVRDRYPQVLFDLRVLDSSRWPGRLLIRLEHWLYRHAFARLAATRGLSRNIEADCSVSVPVFRNGFDADVFEHFSCPPQPRRAPKFRVLIHGLFGRLFDADTFLNIAKTCAEEAPPHEFVLAGYGPNLQMVLDKALPNVSYLGHLDHAQVLVLLEEVDLGLSLHLEQAKDSFPVKVFEYIGAGLPCVVMPRSEAGIEVQAAGMGWAFDGGDWKACSRLLTELMQNPERLHSVAQRTHEQRLQYSRQHQATALIDAVQRWQSGPPENRIPPAR